MPSSHRHDMEHADGSDSSGSEVDFLDLGGLGSTELVAAEVVTANSSLVLPHDDEDNEVQIDFAGLVRMSLWWHHSCSHRSPLCNDAWRKHLLGSALQRSALCSPGTCVLGRQHTGHGRRRLRRTNESLSLQTL